MTTTPAPLFSLAILGFRTQPVELALINLLRACIGQCAVKFPLNLAATIAMCCTLALLSAKRRGAVVATKRRRRRRQLRVCVEKN